LTGTGPEAVGRRRSGDRAASTDTLEPSEALSRSGAVRSLVFANAVTSFGASITEFALPLIALTALHASSTVVAALYAVSLAAQAVASLPAGVWIDRTNQKHAMILGLLAGALVMLCVPVAAETGGLSAGLLFLVAVGAGLSATVVQVSAQALVPVLAKGPALVSTNAGLAFGRSLGTMVGPGAGGMIIGLLSAGSALLFAGASQLISAVLLLRLPATAPVRLVVDRSRLAVRQGIQAVVQDPALLRIVIGTTAFSLGGGLIGSLYFPFAYHDLGLTPVGLGIAAMTGNVGLLIGSTVATRVVRRLGLIRASMLTITFAVASFVLIPLARLGAPLAVLTAYEFLFGMNVSVFRVCVATLRHERTTADLQGRVFSVVLLGPMFGAPVGALLAAGLAALRLSVLSAIMVGIAISAVSLTVYWSPGWRRAQLATTAG
jgi:MFS family permease